VTHSYPTGGDDRGRSQTGQALWCSKETQGIDAQSNRRQGYGTHASRIPKIVGEQWE
jgi:hypothetical protein